MKAIETFYDGYKFRSRLEARWAVFFKEIGWHYEYEPEGFVLEDGTPYLPDFNLPSIYTWVEVKPDAPTEEDIRKCILFSKGLGINGNVILANGLPRPVGYSCFNNGIEIGVATITSYIRQKDWSCPYFGEYWDPSDFPAFGKAKRSRFEFGQKG